MLVIKCHENKNAHRSWHTREKSRSEDGVGFSDAEWKQVEGNAKTPFEGGPNPLTKWSKGRRFETRYKTRWSKSELSKSVHTFVIAGQTRESVHTVV